MSVDELTRELERLRADVKALETAREQASGDRETVTTAPQPAVPPGPAPAYEASAVAGAQSPASAGSHRGASQEDVSVGTTGDTKGDTASGATDPVVDPKLRSQIEELGDLLHDELKSMPAVTSLTVFTLGILLGRFLR